MSEMPGERELADLVRWTEVWDRVCATAWGDDDKPPPSWEEVVARELPDWRNAVNMGADGWDAYMRERLVLSVSSYLHAIGKHPSAALTTPPST